MRLPKGQGQDQYQGQDQERGTIAILMALCMTVFFGFAALGFDLAYVRYAREELQNATDAAAHAALVRLRATGSIAQARQMAQIVAAQNRTWGKSLTLQDSDIVFGGWSFSSHKFTSGVSPPNAVQVNGSRSAATGVNGPVALTFGRIFGQNSIDLVHNGTAAYRIRSIVVAQDVTGSFSDNIDQACQADVSMLDTLHSFNISADRIGMQLFTGDGSPVASAFTALTNLRSNYNTVRNQWQGDGKNSADPSKASGITVCNKLDLDPHWPAPYDHGWVPHCSQGGDGTNLGAAIKRAADQLVAQSQPYETRVIILITDGMPECCTISGTNVTCDTSGACPDARAQYGTDMANAAAAADISIFTVSFGASASQAAYNASLARGIGTAYNTPDATQLASILVQIAGTIPIALVK